MPFLVIFCLKERKKRKIQFFWEELVATKRKQQEDRHWIEVNPSVAIMGRHWETKEHCKEDILWSMLKMNRLLDV